MESLARKAEWKIIARVGSYDRTLFLIPFLTIPSGEDAQREVVRILHTKKAS